MKILCAAKTAKEIILSLHPGANPGLYFLDLESGGDIKGFELAGRVREQDPQGFIVFITTYEELSPLAFEYQIGALDYISKNNPDIVPGRIKECMLKAVKLYQSYSNQYSRKLPLKIAGKIISIDARNIYCIVAAKAPHSIRIIEEHGFTGYHCPLSAVEQKLDRHFFRCHKSSIIQLDYIREIDMENHSVTLMNDCQCPVAVRKMSELMCTYEDFCIRS